MNYITIISLSIFFVFFMTVLGSSLVFVFNKISSKNKFITIVLGFASGIMISASIFSLILPALDQNANNLASPVLITSIGILLGGAFLSLLTYLQMTKKLKKSIKSKKNYKRFYIKYYKKLTLKTPKNTHIKHKKLDNASKLFIAVTLHNIPEGLAVGLAFGMALQNLGISLMSAIMLAISIGIQNFPEGIAVAFPMKLKTKSTKQGFIYGALSGSVEPIFAVLGILLINVLPSVMPLLLSFSAGAMIFVVVNDLITDKSFVKNSLIGTWSFLIGFLIMMIFDVVL